MPTIESLNQFLEAHQFTRRYGFRVLSAADGECELLVPYLPENDRPGPIVSGQVFMHAADVAFWLAVKSKLGVAEEYVTATMTTAFLGPARLEELVCRAYVLKAGRRLIYGEAECRTAERLLTRHTLSYARVGG